MRGWTTREIDAPARPYLTAGQVASLFGFDSTTTVYDMVKAGQLPEPVKRSGTSVWTWKDIVLANLLMEARDRMRLADAPAPTPPAAKNPTRSDRKRPDQGEVDQSADGR